MSPTAVSATTETSNRFVAARLPRAAELGVELAELVHQPDAFLAAIHRGFKELADASYVEGQRLVAPGLGPVLGVRLPLMEAADRAFKRGTRRTATTILLDAADRLLRAEPRELRWFAIWNLGRLLPSDPERTWQLLRRAASEADEWITVDTLAHPYAEGILLDHRRWAEIEQLVYSPSRWERRLVGSTLATLPHVRGVPGGRGPVMVERGLALVAQLIGDAEPDVQKALSWALRNTAVFEPAAIARFLEKETEIARATDDGQRAWVIRDSLAKMPGDVAANLRGRLEGIRRRPGAASTSRAAATASQFANAFAAGSSPRPDQHTREE